MATGSMSTVRFSCCPTHFSPLELGLSYWHSVRNRSLSVAYEFILTLPSSGMLSAVWSAEDSGIQSAAPLLLFLPILMGVLFSYSCATALSEEEWKHQSELQHHVVPDTVTDSPMSSTPTLPTSSIPPDVENFPLCTPRTRRTCP